MSEDLRPPTPNLSDTKSLRYQSVSPVTIEEIVEVIGSHDSLKIGANYPYRMTRSNEHASLYKNKDGKFKPAQGAPLYKPIESQLLLENHNKLVTLSIADQLVTVQSGMLLSDLNASLNEHGFEIPIGLRITDQAQSIGDMVALNLPHWNLSANGSWRDWIVRMKIVLADGTLITSGANVVKNVSGFDLHKLITGARHTLGIVVEVTLRIRPISETRDFPPIVINHGDLVLTTPSGIQKILEMHQKDIDSGLATYFINESNSLLLINSVGGRDASTFGHLWRSNQSSYALPEFSESEKKLMKRTKEIFDPTYKLNPGEFGFI